MTEVKTENQTGAATCPQQVWPLLTAPQQEAVWQTIVRVCHQVASQWEKEAKNEPESDE